MLFTNQSLNIDSSYWDFGNGNGLEYNINNLNEVIYESNLNGSSIDVMLIVNNQLGCRDTSVQTFTIKEAFYDLAIETIFVQDINGVYFLFLSEQDEQDISQTEYAYLLQIPLSLYIPPTE